MEFAHKVILSSPCFSVDVMILRAQAQGKSLKVINL